MGVLKQHRLDVIEAFRENIAKRVCNKYKMQAFVIDTGNQVMVLCCCKEFTAQLKADMETETKEAFSGLHVSFVTGHLDFV